MSFLSFLIGLVVFCGLLVLAFWIGFYIVLPIVFIVLIVSSITSLIKAFEKNTSHQKKLHDEKNNVIDVEFEEIK